jgi:hypothetical protein
MDKKQSIQLVTNGHALRNVLKRSQNVMNGAYPSLGQQLLALVPLNPRIKGQDTFELVVKSVHVNHVQLDQNFVPQPPHM